MNESETRLVHVNQGQFFVSSNPRETLTTVLGSCVSACLYDPVAGVGGMNHFLLADASPTSNGSLKFGLHAMELLINALLKEGAQRDRLHAKLFGGAQMTEGLSDIGPSNAKFALWFIEQERIPCVSQSLGGRSARRIRFSPSSGQARQLIISANEVQETNKPIARSTRASTDENLTLF